MSEQISREQSRAARGLLGWNQTELAEAAKVSRQTVVDFERGARMPYDRTLLDMQRAFEKAGVVFIDSNGGGPGVRLKRKVRR